MKNGRKIDTASHFTWVIIALIVASVMFDVAHMFVPGSALLWIGAGCFAAAIGLIVLGSKKGLWKR